MRVVKSTRRLETSIAYQIFVFAPSIAKNGKSQSTNCGEKTLFSSKKRRRTSKFVFRGSSFLRFQQI